MGYSRWDHTAYTASYAPSRAVMSREEIFTEVSINDDMNPKGVEFREARDSDQNPASTPIIIGLDVTGSMGFIPEYMVKEGLGEMVNEILQRRPVTDPAMLIMGIGDAEVRDRAPLQVGQFESDLVIAEWLEKLYLEGGGGGNDHESYDLAYYFAANHTRTDSHEIRNSPGVIITIGDEKPNPVTRRSNVQRLIGGGLQDDIQFSDLIRVVRPLYIPYHIIIAEGSFARRRGAERLKADWGAFLGSRALILNDYTKIAPLVVSILEIEAGRPVEGAIGSWSSSIQAELRRSFAGFTVEHANGSPRLPRRMDI